MKKEMLTSTEIIDKFRDKEYIHDFEIKNNIMTSADTNEAFKPEEIKIEKTERYEDESNPDHMSNMYAITAASGTKGILTDAYGTYEGEEITEFIKNVPVYQKPLPK